MSAKKFAEIVLLAAKIYSDSYDKEAAVNADTADQKRQDEEKAAGATFTYCLVDFSKFYRKNLYQACSEAALQQEESFHEFGFPAYLALFSTWNDILDWAKEIEAGNSYATLMSEPDPSKTK